MLFLSKSSSEFRDGSQAAFSCTTGVPRPGRPRPREGPGGRNINLFDPSCCC